MVYVLRDSIYQLIICKPIKEQTDAKELHYNKKQESARKYIKCLFRVVK